MTSDDFVLKDVGSRYAEFHVQFVSDNDGVVSVRLKLTDDEGCVRYQDFTYKAFRDMVKAIGKEINSREEKQS